MDYNEIYKLIYKRFRLVQRPTDLELKSLSNQLLHLYDKKGAVTNDDLLSLINSTFANKIMLLNESVDMTASINIAEQIIQKLKSETKG